MLPMAPPSFSPVETAGRRREGSLNRSCCSARGLASWGRSVVQTPVSPAKISASCLPSREAQTLQGLLGQPFLPLLLISFPSLDYVGAPRNPGLPQTGTPTILPHLPLRRP